MKKAIKEAICLHGLIGDLRIHQEHICVFVIVQSVIHLLKNEVHNSLTKHVDVRFHFVH